MRKHTPRYFALLAAAIGSTIGSTLLCAADPTPPATSAPSTQADALRTAIAQLKSKDASTRYAAAQKLATLGPAAGEAVPDLIALFTDFEKVWTNPPSSDYALPAQAAVEACGKIGAPAIPLLSKALRDKNSQVRYNATEALRIQGDAGLEPLLQAFREGAFDGFALAAGPHALSRKAVDPLLAMLADKDAKMRLRACDAFRCFPAKEAVGLLIDHLADDDADVRWKAADALYGQHKIAVAPLIAALKDSNPLKRQGAAAALGRMNEASAAPALAAMLGTDKEAGDFALDALAKLGKTGIAPLGDLLLHGAAPAQLRCAEQLGLIKDKAAANALLAALDTKDPELRRMIVRSLGRIGPAAAPAAGKEILPLLRTEDPELRAEVAQALGLLKEKVAVDDLILILYTGVAAPRAASSQPATQPAALLEFLPEPQRPEPATRMRPGGGDPATQPFDATAYEHAAAAQTATLNARCNAAGALGLIGDPRAFEPLRTTLAKGGKNLRTAAASGLGPLHDPRATPLLAALLKDVEPDVVFAAVNALGETHDAGAAVPLIDYYRAHQDDPRGYAGNAASSLYMLGRAATPALLRVVQDDKQKSMRIMALQKLTRDDPRVPRPLMQLLDDPDVEIRRAAENVLAGYAHKPIEDDLPMWREWWKANSKNYPE